MADDFVEVCSECGKIGSGPEAGQHVPNWDKARGHSRDEPQSGQYATYKGQRIQHSICDDCSNKALEETRRKHAQKDHIWFRKPGK